MGKNGRQDLTDITLVVDRSGSMAARQSDAQGGINTFIKDQKKADGEAALTLVQFDTDYEVVMDGVPIEEVGKYQLMPRGATALLDAVGKAITVTQERIRAMAKTDRPGLVVFVIVTDGEENSSREWDRPRVKALIEKRTAKGWQFVFLGASPEAFAEAGRMGVSVATAAVLDAANYGVAYTATSANLSAARHACFVGDSDLVSLNFSDEDRKKMK